MNILLKDGTETILFVSSHINLSQYLPMYLGHRQSQIARLNDLVQRLKVT